MAWTWNYRIMRSGEGDLRSYFISEVYYGADRPIEAWSKAIAPIGDTEDQLRADFALMLRALDHPVLIEEELTAEVESRIEEPTSMTIAEMLLSPTPYCDCGFGHAMFDHTADGCTWAGCPCAKSPIA
jgi:hypothetical protein